MCESSKEKLNNKFLNYLYENKIKQTNEILELLKKERNETFFNIKTNELEYKYQYYPNIISNDICDFIINESEKYPDV